MGRYGPPGSEINMSKTDIWNMPMPSKPSWGVRGIFRARESAIPHICYSIGDGRKIELWKFPWHPAGVLSSVISRHSTDLSLSSLSLLAQIHHVQRWNPILSIPSLKKAKDLLAKGIFNNSNKNIPIWKPEANGSFTLESAWDSIRVKNPKPPWYSLVWFRVNTPKEAIVVWKSLQNRLPTRDRLPFHVNDKTCPLCSASLESLNHLFFSCGCSAWIWRSLLWRAGWRRKPFRTLSEEGSWIRDKFKGNGQLSTVITKGFQAAIYQIWKERNHRIFENKSTHKTQILKRILGDICFKINQLTTCRDSPHARAIEAAKHFEYKFSDMVRTVQFCSWAKPQKDEVKINSDASLESHCASIGGLIRDDLGMSLAMFILIWKISMSWS
ncbi:uncharacterized protein LOC143863326 [Tasmannia lanceolata]|uniref:uncharacterized protein LOC143863326 n=1 Tax=Tasmannia lanceolata TaxID=3420 RepID=UPI004062FC93